MLAVRIPIFEHFTLGGSFELFPSIICGSAYILSSFLPPVRRFDRTRFQAEHCRADFWSMHISSLSRTSFPANGPLSQGCGVRGLDISGRWQLRSNFICSRL